MYNEETKKELINTIYEKLNSMGITHLSDFKDMFDVDEDATRGLMFMPIDNIQKLVDCPLNKCTTFKDVYQAWGRCGALRFTPYEVDKNYNPSLVLRHNGFLHMFRGYYFQVSGTADGIIDCGSGSYRTNFLTQTSCYNRVLRNGFISYMLWWAALIDVGFRFDNFIEAFNKDIKPIEKFLYDSMRYWNRDTGYKWSDVEKYITFDTGNIDIMQRKMYQLKDNDGVVAYLSIGKKSVQVETADNTLLTIKIPELNEGTDYVLEDYDDLAEFEDEVHILEQNHYLEMIAVMALKLVGIHISFMNFYPLKGRMYTMRPINAPNVTNVTSLNDIYDCTPDEF